MERTTLFTITHPVTGIKDYTCGPEYASLKHLEGYQVTAHLIVTPMVYHPKR